jgi:drug/metabolite transporter (DMT)-like permease
VNACQVFGLAGEGSGVSAVIIYTQPIFVLFLAVPFLKERINSTKILGVVVGFTGVALLFLNKTGSFSLDYGLILIATAILWAISAVYYKKFLCSADAFSAVIVQMVIGTMFLAFLNFGTKSIAFPLNVEYSELILYSAVGAMALGNVLWLELLSREEATTLSSSALLVPAVALFFGWLFLRESFGFLTVLGSIFTLTGVTLANLATNRSYPNPQST